VLGHVIGNARLLEGPPPDGVAEAGAQRDDQLQGAGDAEQHADAPAGGRLGPPAPSRGGGGPGGGGRAGPPGGGGGGARGGGGGGGDGEGGGGERGRVEEAAAGGVDAVRRLRVRVEVVGGTPVGRRHLGDGVDAVGDVGPEGRQAVGAREQTADADDRQGVGL